MKPTGKASISIIWFWWQHSCFVYTSMKNDGDWWIILKGISWQTLSWWRGESVGCGDYFIHRVEKTILATKTARRPCDSTRRPTSSLASPYRANSRFYNSTGHMLRKSLRIYDSTGRFLHILRINPLYINLRLSRHVKSSRFPHTIWIHPLNLWHLLDILRIHHLESAIRHVRSSAHPTEWNHRLEYIYTQVRSFQHPMNSSLRICDWTQVVSTTYVFTA